MDQTGVADVRKDGAAGGRSRPAHEAAPVPFSRCTKGTDALRDAWGHVRDLAPDVVNEWTGHDGGQGGRVRATARVSRRSRCAARSSTRFSGGRPSRTCSASSSVNRVASSSPRCRSPSWMRRWGGRRSASSARWTGRPGSAHCTRTMTRYGGRLTGTSSTPTTRSCGSTSRIPFLRPCGGRLREVAWWISGRPRRRTRPRSWTGSSSSGPRQPSVRTRLRAAGSLLSPGSASASRGRSTGSGSRPRRPGRQPTWDLTTSP